VPLGNDLADHNTVGSAAGQIGRAADFEARDEEFLSISDTLQSGLDVTGSLTLVGWMNPESLPSPQILAGKYEWGCTNRAYRFDFREGDTLPRPTRPLAPVPRSRRTTGFARCECPSRTVISTPAHSRKASGGMISSHGPTSNDSNKVTSRVHPPFRQAPVEIPTMPAFVMSC